MAELQQFCKEVWDKIPPQHCGGLIASHSKYLIAGFGGNPFFTQVHVGFDLVSP